MNREPQVNRSTDYLLIPPFSSASGAPQNQVRARVEERRDGQGNEKCNQAGTEQPRAGDGAGEGFGGNDNV